MKTTQIVLGSILSASLVAGSALAGPLNKRHVPANAHAVVHIDVEAGLSSAIGQFILENADEFDLEPLQQLDQIKQETGLDPHKDIFDITILVDENEEGTIIATTSSAIDDALEAIAEKMGEGFSTSRLAGHGVNVISTGGGGESVYLYVAESGRRRTVVAGQDADKVAAAIAAVAGDAENLSDSDSPLADASPRDGAIVFIAANDPGEIIGEKPLSKILSESSAVFAQFGEVGDDAFAEVSLRVDSEKAKMVADAATGLVALGKLIAHSEDTGSDVKEARVELLSALTFEAERDGTVTVALRYDVEKFLKLVEQANQYR